MATGSECLPHASASAMLLYQASVPFTLKIEGSAKKRAQRSDRLAGVLQLPAEGRPLCNAPMDFMDLMTLVVDPHKLVPLDSTLVAQHCRPHAHWRCCSTWLSQPARDGHCSCSLSQPHDDAVCAAPQRALRTMKA